MFGPCHFSSCSSLWSGYTTNNDIPIHLRTRDLCFNHITFCLSSFSAQEQIRPGFSSSISPQIHSKSWENSASRITFTYAAAAAAAAKHYRSSSTDITHIHTHICIKPSRSEGYFISRTSLRTSKLTDERSTANMSSMKSSFPIYVYIYIYIYISPCRCTAHSGAVVRRYKISCRDGCNSSFTA